MAEVQKRQLELGQETEQLQSNLSRLRATASKMDADPELQKSCELLGRPHPTEALAAAEARAAARPEAPLPPSPPPAPPPPAAQPLAAAENRLMKMMSLDPEPAPTATVAERTSNSNENGQRWGSCGGSGSVAAAVTVRLEEEVVAAVVWPNSPTIAARTASSASGKDCSSGSSNSDTAVRRTMAVPPPLPGMVRRKGFPHPCPRVSFIVSHTCLSYYF